jgi:hypothetical protein
VEEVVVVGAAVVEAIIGIVGAVSVDGTMDVSCADDMDTVEEESWCILDSWVIAVFRLMSTLL